MPIDPNEIQGDYDEMPDLEGEDWENEEIELCEDQSCETCYPVVPDSQERIVSEIPVYWGTMMQGTSQQFDVNTVSNTTNDSIQVAFGRINARQDAMSGADIEETPEGEIVPENPEVVEESGGPVRPAPILNNEHIYFHDSSGGRIRPGSGVIAGGTIQIPIWNLSASRVRELYAELKAWMVENEFYISTHTSEYMQEDDFSANIPYYFTLCERNTRRAIDPTVLFSQPDCGCGRELEYPTIVCPDCEELQWCGACRAFDYNVRNDQNHGSYCSRCGVSCSQCGESFHRNNERCDSCNPSVRCSGCRSRYYPDDPGVVMHEHFFENGMRQQYCSHCYEGLCYSCATINEHENIIEDEGHQCVSCVSMNSNEEWDESSALENEDLAIPTIPGRETIRMVGVEIEGANGENQYDHDGGIMLAQALYSEGLSSTDQFGGYHSGGRSGRSRGLVHVERDSSVDWEMVIGPLNVADSGHVDILNKSVKVVRAFINDKALKLDMRAGLHIHVEAAKVPFHNAYNLHKLYMYMEDFLYRFGAAKWPYHRSITRRGRDQAGKSPNTEGKLHFARTFSGQRYYGLSFDNYFARYFEQCGCGARNYGLFGECTCDLGKCTFEFRLFNTTANTVKLHAYLAMSQALVAKAIEMEEIKDLAQFPALDFVKSRVSDMHASTRRKMTREWEKRIVFVNEQLPLTPEEKKSIHYCIMNSEMGKTVTNADILLESEDN